MNTLSLDEIIADGQAAINAEIRAAKHASDATEARIKHICDVALSVAKQFIPDALHSYIRPVFDYPADVNVQIEIPNALPVSIIFHNSKASFSNIDTLEFDNPANWEIYTNRVHREIFIWDEKRDSQIFTGGFSDLPRALAIAKLNYLPEQKEVVNDFTRPTNLYDTLHYTLDDMEEGDHQAIFMKVIARALVDIAASLDVIQRHYS